MRNHRLPLLFVAVAALAGQSARAEPGTRCDGAALAKQLGLAPREWQVACWRVEDGREVIAAVPLPPLVPASELLKSRPHKEAKPSTPPAPLVVRLALARDAAILWRGEIKPDGKSSPDVREVLDRSEEWLVGIDDQTLGRERGVRIGVVGHWGEEEMSVREIALLFRLPTDGGALRLLWSGLGNTRESRLDYCRIEGIATFQLVDDKTLERQLRVTPSVNREVKLARSKARALEKKCVGESPNPQRFPVSLQ
ncbi:MAG TPA: hypothetical protein VN914_08110 [Polyangia bacterium]|nr:hypothetical protein [Polyangia bacterium]